MIKIVKIKKLISCDPFSREETFNHYLNIWRAEGSLDKVNREHAHPEVYCVEGNLYLFNGNKRAMFLFANGVDEMEVDYRDEFIPPYIIEMNNSGKGQTIENAVYRFGGLKEFVL